MLPLCCSQTSMQGSFVRGTPSRLTSSLYASVSRRISWAGIARCADGSSVSSQSVNPSSTATEQFNTTVQDPGPKALPPALAPLPSESRNGTFRLERGEWSSSSHNERFRSVGSRSEPSRPSIPGKFSKYSKPIGNLHTASLQKRAERRDKKAFRKPMGDIAAEPDWNVVSRDESRDESSSFDAAASTAKKKNASAMPPPVDKTPEWMQHYQFSYSEIPSAPIIGFRETPWSPFGPQDMVVRPWTGSAPLKPSKKKRPEFDSFKPPPAGKKGVKYVQKPGPFPPGEGPKPGKTREEILGAPLTPLEIQELVTSMNKGSKQLNLGRDGLTHNMLDVIHSHWKRSVCCKIKCKGVPTVDLDNVARVIEEKTGGVIIHRAGGVMFVFRGRNYNYKDRPKIPIMLWKPPDPIYPRLIQAIPEGLTEQEAKDLRAKGRRVAPLCKLGKSLPLAKNGVYMTLVADVKAQFEIDEVVRVDCQGMHATDYKKIGAKLKDLVPCTLLSFEKEQIIMCRKKPVKVGNDYSDQVNQGEDKKGLDALVDGSDSIGSSGLLVTDEYVPAVDELEQKLVLAEDEESVTGQNPELANPVIDGNPEDVTSGMDGNPKGNLENGTPVMSGHLEDESSALDENVGHAAATIDRNTKHVVSDVVTEDARLVPNCYTEDASSVTQGISKDPISVTVGNVSIATTPVDVNTEYSISVTGGNVSIATTPVDVNTEYPISVTSRVTEGSSVGGMDDVDLLWQKAIDEGKALQLDNQIADPDAILEKAVELSDVLEATESEERAANEWLEKERIAEQNKVKAQVPPTSPFDVPPIGGLGVDELAKLLAP